MTPLPSLSEIVTRRRQEEQVAEHGGARARREARGEVLPPIGSIGTPRLTAGVREEAAARALRLEDLRMAARQPVDLVEVLVARALRDLVVACERGSRARLGPVGRGLIQAARDVSAVDRQLVELANERGREAARELAEAR